MTINQTILSQLLLYQLARVLCLPSRPIWWVEVGKFVGSLVGTLVGTLVGVLVTIVVGVYVGAESYH